MGDQILKILPDSSNDAKETNADSGNKQNEKMEDSTNNI